MSEATSFNCFSLSPYFSSKHKNYFPIYDKIFDCYKGRDIVFIEFGVFAGGSLFMWREYFGPKARIIGVDLNPDALKWRDHGFEIYVGDQSDPIFLNRLFAEIGQVDIVLDDGGHKYDQQIITSLSSLRYIKDNGLLVVEDTHTSYQKEFGAGSKYSFINWAKKCIDTIHGRFPDISYSVNREGDVFKRIFSITFYESLCVFNVNSSLCLINEKVVNDGEYSNQVDFRYSGTTLGRLLSFRRRLLNSTGRRTYLKRIFKKIDLLVIISGKTILSFWERYKLLKLRSLFK